MSPLAARDPNMTDEEEAASASGQTGPLLVEVDHVAIAVADLAEALDTYREAFDVVVEHREVDDDEGVEEAYLAVAESYVALVAPVRDDSPVAELLAERGGGLLHVAYRVQDCTAVWERLLDQGYQEVDDRPRRRGRGLLTVRVRDPHGTVVALVEA